MLSPVVNHQVEVIHSPSMSKLLLVCVTDPGTGARPEPVPGRTEQDLLPGRCVGAPRGGAGSEAD